MRFFPVLLTLFVLTGSAAYGQATAKDAPLEPGKITEIACECTDALIKKYKAADAKIGTYHYKVYIPEGYDKETDRKYPAFFFFSPGGNASMGHLADRLKKEKWIGIMHVEAKNGPWGDILGNMVAAYDDATTRLRINDKMKYATGFSGGARMSSVFACLFPGVSGIICQGAGFGELSGVPSISQEIIKRKISICMMVGNKDDNKYELEGARETFKNYAFFYGDTFDGGHSETPANLMLKSFDFMLDNTYFSAAKGSIPKAVLLDAIKNKAATAADSSATALSKFDALNWISTIITRESLAADTDFKDIAESTKKQIEELKKDPTYKTESAAKDSYVKTQAMEKAARDKMQKSRLTGNALKAALSQIAAAYDAIAKKNPDTEYGKLAAARVDAINKEKEEADKPKK